MKTMWLAVLLLTSCASWNQKDFVKDIEESPDATPAITGEMAPILEKYEVKEVEKPIEAPPASKKVKVTTPVKKKVAQTLVKQKTPETVVTKPELPADYPQNLVEADEKAKKTWELYRPNHTENEKTFLDIHYLGMTVGKIMVMNKGKKQIDGKEVWHFHARFKSAPFYSKIYELDDTVDTYVNVNDFLSVKYTVLQRESKQDIDDIQLLDHEARKVHWLYQSHRFSDGKKKNKKDENYIPFHSIDAFSTLFFYQGLPLKDGDVYEIPIVNKGKVLILRSHVQGREKIETVHGDKKAIRVHATTQYTGKTLKSGDLTFWLSDDGKKTLLKAKAKISLGSVTADLVKE